MNDRFLLNRLAKMPMYGFNQRFANPSQSKGSGYLGQVPTSDGRVSTEISVGTNIDGREMEIPSMVPTLSKEELDELVATQRPNPSVMRKAIEFAKFRMAQGKDVWAGEDEQMPLLPWTGDDKLQRLLAERSYGRK